MRKLSVLFLSVVLVLSLSACGGGSAPTISGVEDKEVALGTTFDLMSGVTANDKEDGDLTSDITTSGTVDTTKIGTYKVTYTVIDKDGTETKVERIVTVKGEVGEPEVITIMHGAVYEIDPFHEDYSGTKQKERQDLQREIEAKYNVVINYENYPSSAAWGPDRVSAINQASVAGEPMSDIYGVTSDWLQELVVGNSITPVTKYMNTIGTNIPDAYGDVGEYQGEIYGFEAYRPIADSGLYYNADLVASLGVENPTQLYLDGNWNWSTFETWATSVQTALDAQPDDMYALGGMLSYYAEFMTALNGGSKINKSTGRVAFAQKPALDTYSFISNLWSKGLFEPNGSYDAGSPEWQGGKVAMHPGQLWFVTSDARWGGLSFEIGYVPYPVADDYTGEYITPISGVAIMTMASGMSAKREELVFKVWNEIQLFETDSEADMNFELQLMSKFDRQNYVDAYMEIYDKVYLDVTDALGISQYSESGWTRNINIAIKDGTSRTAMDAIRPTYERALEDYLGE